jgi:hypothetical protein
LGTAARFSNNQQPESGKPSQASGFVKPARFGDPAESATTNLGLSPVIGPVSRGLSQQAARAETETRPTESRSSQLLSGCRLYLWQVMLFWLSAVSVAGDAVHQLSAVCGVLQCGNWASGCGCMRRDCICDWDTLSGCNPAKFSKSPKKKAPLLPSNNPQSAQKVAPSFAKVYLADDFPDELGNAQRPLEK